MKQDDIFTKQIMTETVKLSPRDLHKNYMNTIRSILIDKFENKCSHYGYIKKDSIELLRVSMGIVEVATFAGYSTFDVRFRADVCNPLINSIVSAKVKTSNQFALMCMCGYTDPVMGVINVLQILIPKQTVMIRSDVNLGHIKIGDTVNIEILGKKYQLNDSKLNIVGKIVKVTDKTLKTEKMNAVDEDENDVESDDDDIELEIEEDDEEKEEDDMDIPRRNDETLIEGEGDGDEDDIDAPTRVLDTDDLEIDDEIDDDVELEEDLDIEE